MDDRGKPRSIDPDESKRLESWKEIASYLDRSPRTVRRWERDEGLPVHRHRHAKGSTVFAFAEELDRWLVGRVARSQASTPPLPAAAAAAAAVVDATSEAARADSGRLAFRLVAVSSLVALALATAALVVSLSAEDPADPLGAWISSIPVERRLLLEATYFGSRGNHEGVLQALEAAAGVGPIGREAIEMGLRSCDALDEPLRCVELVRQAADQSIDDAVLQAMAAVELARVGGDLEGSLGYAERAVDLSAENPAALDPELFAFVELLPARKAWLDGDVATSAAQLDRLRSRAAGLDQAAVDAMARAAGRHCLALGRIECALSWFAHIDDESERRELESYALFAAGKTDELAAHLAASSDYRWPETAILMAMAGHSEAAARLVERLDTDGVDAGTLEVARGGLDLIAGRPMEAAEKLTSGVSKLRPAGADMHFIGLDMLSRIAESDGRLDRAAELLEMTDAQRGHAALLGSGLFWIKCQTRLAEVYRGMGRVDDALRVERELLTALALSDPDHPTTAALKRRSV